MIGQEIYILTIDDEPALLERFSEIFLKEGYQAVKARSWLEALQQLKLQKFNVVIADVNLPDISCAEMIKAIKNERKGVYLITTAGYTDIEKAMESLKQGADDYISKPFNPPDLRVSIRRILERQKLQTDNIQLYETIKALALALDARDHYTHGHSQEVTEYAVLIAEKMKLSEEEIKNIRDAGVLHDIGKIGISDAVLLKPGRLTEEEYNQIKTHPVIAKKILEPVNLLTDKIPLIYHHHERFDGEGYPEGLKAEEIPLGARILAVADAYQAMVSNRPYRFALSKKEAIRELEINKGKQFDPAIVDVFLQIIEKI